VSPAAADPAWEDTKAYTAFLKDKAASVAKEAVAVAAAALAAATQDVVRAKANVTAANTAATSAAALAALAKAEAALVSAEAILAGTKTVAAGAAAVVGGAVIGTAIGQGLRAWWDFCLDPVCSATAINIGPGPIYIPPTTGELQALIPTLDSIALGWCP
jgi:hypothetical protein